MSKRFTDTDKYKKPFIKSLPGAYKLFWDYLYHDCSFAGIWEVDFEIAQIKIGKDMPISEQKALELFNADKSDPKIIIFDDGKKWFIPSFIEFQYGKLNAKNRVHGVILKELNKYGLAPSDTPLNAPLDGAKDKDKDKDCISINENTVDKSKVFQALPENLKEPIRQYVKVYNFNHGKLHEGQFDLMLQGMLRIPKDSRIESIALSTMKKHKFICDCRNDFSKLATVSETRTEPKKEPFREFGGIYAD